MGKLYRWTAWTIALCLSCQTSATVLTFEDLSERVNISEDSSNGILYEGIYWEFGNNGAYGLTGSWIVPDNPGDEDYYNIPHSGTKNINNKWGCTEIGFQFLESEFELGAFVTGAYFAVQGYSDNWAGWVMAMGYKEDALVWETTPLLLSETPLWLAMGELAVDRVVIIAQPRSEKTYGYFGMDDLTFTEVIIPEPMTLLLLALGAAAIRRRK